MPQFDGKGPTVLGPLTGRGMGYCVVKLDPELPELIKKDGKGVNEMPGGDRTGPMGMGPMTGRGAGYCAGNPTAGYSNTMPGRGFARGRGGRGLGRGFGRGMGFRRMSPYTNGPVLSSQEEANLLKTQASSMQNEINSINARIKELEPDAVQGENG